jgi:hypothetical protein
VLVGRMESRLYAVATDSMSTIREMYSSAVVLDSTRTRASSVTEMQGTVVHASVRVHTVPDSYDGHHNPFCPNDPTQPRSTQRTTGQPVRVRDRHSTSIPTTVCVLPLVVSRLREDTITVQ